MKTETRTRILIITGLITSASYLYAACWVDGDKKCKDIGQAASSGNNYRSSCVDPISHATVRYETAYKSTETAFIDGYKGATNGQSGVRFLQNTVQDCEYSCDYTDPCRQYHLIDCSDWDVPTSVPVSPNQTNGCTGSSSQ
jgi:hypothetical protein